MVAPAHTLDTPAFFLCLVVLAAHRVASSFWLGIAPDPAFLVGHWQHLALGDLRDDLVGSLILLQSQPPLWNAIIGLGAVACGGELACVVGVLRALHLAVTLALFVVLLRIGARLLGHPGAAALVALGFCLSPAVVYYENYLFYPHLSALLFAVFAWALMVWLEHRRRSALIALGLALVLMAWLWTLFHPVFVALVLMAALLAARPLPRASLVVAVGMLGLALMPSIKNQVVFGFFGAGSWLGLNLAQVAPGGVEGCGFGDFIVENDLVGVHLGTALNDPRIIDFSAQCRREAMARIRDHPLAYAAGRGRQVLSALSMRPSDYIFDPLNWARYPAFLPETEIRNADGRLRPLVLASRLAVLAFNLAVLGFMAVRAVRGCDPLERRFLAVTAVFVVLFFAIAHAANGGEQERMRYTIHPLLWLYGWLMIGSAVRRVAVLRRT